MPSTTTSSADDFDRKLGACIAAMLDKDTVGQTLVFMRDKGRLHVLEVAAEGLLHAGIDRYEMVLFDGGNRHGDLWKHLFFPAQRAHAFIYESH